MSDVALEPRARDAIQQAFVSENVSVPEGVFYQGPAESISFGVGGLVGAAIVQSIEAGSEKKLTMQDLIRAMPMDQIVHESFENALRASGTIPVGDDPATTDVAFSFKIEVYGLGQTQGFSSTLYPVVGFHAVLTNPAGEILWQKYGSVSPLSSGNDLGHTAKEYAANPELLRATFENAARLVSRSIVADLE